MTVNATTKPLVRGPGVNRIRWQHVMRARVGTVLGVVGEAPVRSVCFWFQPRRMRTESLTASRL